MLRLHTKLLSGRSRGFKASHSKYVLTVKPQSRSNGAWLLTLLVLPPKNLKGLSGWYKFTSEHSWSKINLLYATFKIKINELMANRTEAGLGKVKDWTHGVGKHWEITSQSKSVLQGFDEFVYAMFRHMYVLFLIGFLPLAYLARSFICLIFTESWENISVL